MIAVEGGTFMMGSNEDSDEKPVHKVTVSDFYIGKYEVTQKQWQAVMGNNPSNLKETISQLKV
jgi:formylglycine-generating enzyme required for sulfatase activity